MPIEIRELVIQACLSDEAGTANGVKESPAKSGNDLQVKLLDLEQKVDIRFHKLRKDLLQECIEEVLEILEEKQRILR